ncbi:hypothetical protein PT520_09690 [Aliarcobacter butzleri]|uniref:Uncharacterized protein n=1 Tax=Aliarcobacter butzleri TaxID=28197 RepID=A0AAW6VS78_9BACT|nr:hypothetical protein [Aliarcobacter butzleri]MDK2062788.1 hypothetical protein [Aliarcobacter butzleri]
MLVVDFINENKSLIKKQNGNTNISDPDLITYLKRAYTHIQKDKTFFTKTIDITTINNQMQYSLEDEAKDILHLFINTKEYEKKRIDEFYEQYPFQNCNMFAFENGSLFISPIPANNQRITIFYEVIKEFEKDENDKDTFSIPVLFKEAFRYLFLSKVHEETPRKEFVDLSIHYLKLYEKEMAEAKKSTKVKYRNLQSNFKKI